MTVRDLGGICNELVDKLAKKDGLGWETVLSEGGNGLHHSKAMLPLA